MTFRRAALVASVAIATMAGVSIFPAVARLAPAKAAPAHDSAKEPPMEFVLEIDGKAKDVVANEPFEVELAGRHIQAKLVPKPDRLFKDAALSFRYPHHFAFEYEPSDEVTMWTFDGNNSVIMLFRHEQAATPAAQLEESVEGLIEQYGKANVKRGTSTITLAGSAIHGKRIDATLAGSRIRQDVYALESGGKVYVLIVQDSLGDDGKATAETIATVDLLKKTFAINP